MGRRGRGKKNLGPEGRVQRDHWRLVRKGRCLPEKKDPVSEGLGLWVR